MVDKFGSTYELGDKVAHAVVGYGHSRTVEVGRVVKINPKSVRIRCIRNPKWPDLITYTNIMKPSTALNLSKLPEDVWEGDE